MRDLRDKLTKTLEGDAPVLPEEEMSDFLEEDDDFPEAGYEARYGVKALKKAIPKMEKCLGRLDEIMAKESTQEAEVIHAVGKFEAVLDDLLKILQELRYWLEKDYAIDSTPLMYLETIYEHVLEEIRDWLEEFVFALEHPVNNRIIFNTLLTLTSVPETEFLENWFTENAPQKKSGLGFWGMVGAVVLGIGIGNALFGDDA
ncbi:MAG: hypothetical protein LBU46_05480 [Candidatus Accumulibacter sp.]|nr:hypothetical protein [Accumulibacter sp.]